MLKEAIKKIIQFIVAIFIGAGLFILILEKVGLGKILEVIKIFSPWRMAAIFLIFLVDMIILTWRWKLVLESQGRKTSFRKLFAAKLVGFSVNYITPIVYTGGEPARAYVLKKESGIPFAEGLTSVVIDEFLELICGCLFLIVGVIFALTNFNVPHFLLIGLFFVALATLIFWVYFYKKLKSERGLFTSIIDVLRLNKIKFINSKKDKIIKLENDLINFLKYKEPIFLKTIFLTLISFICGLLIIKLVTVFLGLNLSWQGIVLIKVFSVLPGIIPIPAALGTLEAGGALGFMILGLSVHLGITLSLIIRFFNTILMGIGLFLLSHFGVKLADVFLSKGLNNNDNNDS